MAIFPIPVPWNRWDGSPGPVPVPVPWDSWAGSGSGPRFLGPVQAVFLQRFGPVRNLL